MTERFEIRNLIEELAETGSEILYEVHTEPGPSDAIKEKLLLASHEVKQAMLLLIETHKMMGGDK